MAFKVISITFLLIITSNCLYGRKKIIWDTTSMMKIDDNIDYCRIRFLSDGNMAVFYRHLLGCYLKIFDHDMECLMTKRVFSNKNFYNKDIQDSAYVLMSTPDMIELDTGRLLYVCNYRPLKGHRYPFCIASSYSDDKGRSWSEPVVIYEANTLYENGCWEPVLLQHKNGNVQLYFSNENGFRRTDEQEIDMIESYNGGK